MSDSSLANKTHVEQGQGQATAPTAPVIINPYANDRRRAELLAERPWLRFYQQGVPAELDIPAQPLTWLLDNAVKHYASRAAILYFGNRLTYAQLSTLANRFAVGLQKLGISKGDRVAIALPNIPQYLIAYFGVL